MPTENRTFHLCEQAKQKINLLENAVKVKNKKWIEQDIVEAAVILNILSHVLEIKKFEDRVEKTQEKWYRKKFGIGVKKLVKAEKLYTKLAKFYGQAKAMRLLFKIEESEVEPLVSDLKGKYVLDVGCGTGRWSNYFAKKGANVVGIDANKKMLQIAKKKVKGVFKIIDARKLEFPAKTFDYVFASLVLGHIKDFKKAFAEMIRVAKPEGFIVVSELHGSRWGRKIKPPFKVPFLSEKGKEIYTLEWPIYPADLVEVAIKNNCEIINLKEPISPSYWKLVETKPRYTPLLLTIKVRKKNS